MSTGDTVCSTNDKDLSSSPNLDIMVNLHLNTGIILYKSFAK
jgi:hypothetical protein